MQLFEWDKASQNPPCPISRSHLGTGHHFMPQDNSPPIPTHHRFQKRGFSYESAIKYFFASNAGLTIVILALIIVFLLKEGLGFFPGYRRELEVYRVAGLEFVDISRKNLTAHEQLASVLNRAYFAEINGKCALELQRSQQASALFNAYSEQVSATRELVINNLQTPAETNPAMLATLRVNYEKFKAVALNNLPKTVQLSPTERSSLIESIRNRAVDDSDDPPLVVELNAAYSAAQEKFSQPLQGLRTTIDAFDAAGADLSGLVSEMTQSVTASKAKIQAADSLERERSTLLGAAASAKTTAERDQLTAEAAATLTEKPDIHGELETLLARRGECIERHSTLKQTASGILAQLPASLSQAEAARLLNLVRQNGPLFIAALDQAPAALKAWNDQAPVHLTDAIVSFLTGKDWVTGGEWQDFYGILPLAAGSLMISIVALAIAIPSGIGAAIYVNQFASPWEQALFKPIVEFIQAIPSVVLGFIGILVFGTVLRDLSMLESLRWIPGFPIEERLNIFTAGCLLALMSIPTIFSLAEDAINNVPSAYAEAAEALGASRIQTTFRVIIPAAFSGILAAVLLGLGRVIGETMVVLLVAGNRIKIPDFSSGLGAFFQPCHTLTGIIAQELGEVPLGSVHYRALFVVGIVLFAVVLAINATAHRFVSRMKH
jgi:phosphate transport system permease protein